MIELTNAEWSMVLTVLTKCDPAEIVADLQMVRHKILAEATAQQAAEVAAKEEIESPA